MDLMTVTDEGRLAIYQMTGSPRTVKLKALAGSGGSSFGRLDLDIAGPGGIIGSWQVTDGTLNEYSLSISNMPPGKMELTLKIRNAGMNPAERPPAVLFNNIAVE